VKLGVLGGMGPASSAEFMVRLTYLTPAKTDQDHIPTVLWSDPRIPDRVTSIENNDDRPLVFLLEGIKGLQLAGCDTIVIPCNSAHFWYDELVKLGTPIHHIVDSVSDELLDRDLTNITIGILGSKGTLNSCLYQNILNVKGWQCIIPSLDDIDTLVQPSIKLIKDNRYDEAEFLLNKSIDKLISRGAKAIVLGCTEFPLVIKCCSVPLISSVDSLAKSIIKTYK